MIAETESSLQKENQPDFDESCQNPADFFHLMVKIFDRMVWKAYFLFN